MTMRNRHLITGILSLILILGFVIQSSAQQTVTFNYTGGLQTWTVPQCVTSIDVIVAGAEGGGTNGGDGAVITTTLSVSPGQVLELSVGGQGGCPAAAFGGGGSGQNSSIGLYSCAGGGYSSISVSPFGLTNAVVVAGGGGGTGGGDQYGQGGAGGCANGGAGATTFGYGGGGGTTTSGGAGGNPWTAGGGSGQSGSFGQGGAGGIDVGYGYNPGGGGGGGYYGGGGAGSDNISLTSWAGGGGGGAGSSLVPAGANCSGTNTGDGFISITFVGGLNPNAANTGPYCSGEDIHIGASGGANYSWTGPNGFTSNLQSPVIPAATVADAGVYTVTVTDPNCPGTASASTTVVVNPTPDVAAVSDQSVCHGHPTSAVNFTSSVSGTTFNWTNTNTSTGLAASGSGNIASYTGSAPSTTQVSTITVVPSTASCVGQSETFTITVEPSPVIVAGNDSTICENGTGHLFASATGGGGGPYLYHWDHTTDTQSDQYVNPVADSTFIVYAESASGCFSDSAYVNITLHPPLSGTITPFDTICPGYPTTISATASGGIGQPYHFEWSSGEIHDGAGAHTITANPPSTQDYILTVTDGCESTPLVLSTNIRVAPLPVPQYEVLNPIQCEPAIFEIVNTTDSALSQFVYWEVDGIHQYLNQDTIVSPEFWAGDYEIYMMVTTYEGCVDSIRVEDALYVQPKPVANFGYAPNPVTAFNTTVSFSNYSFNGYTYEWYFEGGYPSSSTQEDVQVEFPEGVIDRYDVILITTSELGCVDTMYHELVVQPEILIYAPNTFTPDDDEFNQDWRVFMEGVDIYDWELLIYDRWGEIIWESHDIEVPWDGQYDGKPLPDGTYVWTIRTRDVLNDDKVEFRGHVTIIR